MEELKSPIFTAEGCSPRLGVLLLLLLSDNKTTLINIVYMSAILHS